MGEEIIIKDNFFLVRNLLSDNELQTLLKYSLKHTSHSISDIPYNVAHYLHDTFDINIIDNIYKKMYEKLKLSHDMNEDKNKDKNVLNKIKHVFDDKNHLRCLYLLYPNNSIGIPRHTDGWSSWNIIISIGESMNLILNRKSIRINQGDVYLFDGNKIEHSIKPIQKASIPKTKIKRRNILKLFNKTKGFSRYCFQLRKAVGKHKKICFYLRTPLRRSLRLQLLNKN